MGRLALAERKAPAQRSSARMAGVDNDKTGVMACSRLKSRPSWAVIRRVYSGLTASWRAGV